MKNSIITIGSLFLLVLLFNVNDALAQTASGKIIYTNIKEATPKPKSINGVTFQNGMMKARLETDDHQSPFFAVTGVCENWAVPEGDGNAFVHGACIFADKDGDTFVTYTTSRRNDKSRVVHVKGGTGKFINLEGKGNSFEDGPPDTGKAEDCCMSKWKIKYKL